MAPWLLLGVESSREAGSSEEAVVPRCAAAKTGILNMLVDETQHSGGGAWVLNCGQ